MKNTEKRFVVDTGKNKILFSKKELKKFITYNLISEEMVIIPPNSILSKL